MRKIILILTVSFLWLSAFGNAAEPEILVIPEPVSVVKKTGKFELPDKIVVSSPQSDEMKLVNETLAKKTFHRNG